MERFALPAVEGLFVVAVLYVMLPATIFDLHLESDSSAMIAAICSALEEPARPARRLERFSLELHASEYVALYAATRGSQDMIERGEMNYHATGWTGQRAGNRY